MPSDRQLARHLGLSEADVEAYRLYTVRDGDHWRVIFAAAMPLTPRAKVPACMTVIVPDLKDRAD